MSRDRIIQLQENAEELGFGTIQEALDNGYNEVQDLVNGTFKLEKVDEQEKAHEAWLKERDHALEILDLVVDVLNEINDGLAKIGDKELVEACSLMELSRETRGVAKFIKEQCHD